MRRAGTVFLFVSLWGKLVSAAPAAEGQIPKPPSEPAVVEPVVPNVPAAPTPAASKPKPFAPVTAAAAPPAQPPVAATAEKAQPLAGKGTLPPATAAEVADVEGRAPAPPPRSRRSVKADRKDPSPPSLTLEALREEIVNSPAEIEKNNLLKERDHLGELAGALDTAQKQLRKDTERLAAFLEETKRQAQASKEDEDAQKPGGSSASKNKAISANQPQAPTPLETLAKAMRGMKPAQAAAIAEKVPLSLAADVLQKMPARDAGRVMGLMNPERAAELASEIASREKTTKRAL